MIRGIYIAASGMLAESLRTDVIANNLANVNTGGFKKDFAVTKDYSSRAIRRINDGQQTPEIGNLGAGVMLDEIGTSQSQGVVKLTSNQLDLMIDGKGFFAVDTPTGTRYTRNGSFVRSSAGELVDSEGHRVIGSNGPITLEQGRVTVSSDGRIFVHNQADNTDIESGQLQISAFADEKRLIKQGHTMYEAPAGVAPEESTASIRQGYLEMSNVNVVSEMVNMIAGYRAYEANSKVVQTHDSLLDKAVNEIARV